MEFHGDRLLPKGLPNLLWEITPPPMRALSKIIAFPRSKRKGLLGHVSGTSDRFEMELYPTAILVRWDSHSPGLVQFRLWRKFLQIALHELGHVMTCNRRRNIQNSEYEKHEEAWRYVEWLAETWAEMMMAQIANRDPRLGQPIGWIGGLAGIYMLRKAKLARAVGASSCSFDTYTYSRIQSIRAHRCGGQLTLKDAICESDEPWKYYRLEKSDQLRIRRLAKHEVVRLRIDRTYIDSADRRHLFFNYGEARILNAALRPHIRKAYDKRAASNETGLTF